MTLPGVGPELRLTHGGTLAALLVFAAVVQLLMLRPPFPSDSMFYFGWAGSIGGNEISHGTTRLGLLVPVRIAIEMFGVSEAAYHLVPAVMHALAIVGLYWLGTLLFDRVVGTGAALLFLTSAMTLEFSTMIVPDTFAAAWFCLSVVAALLAGAGPHRRRWLVAAGLTFGAAYLCREYTLFLAPVVLLLAFRQRWSRGDLLWFVGSAAAVLVLELVALTVLFGDPLARVRALTGFAAMGAAGESVVLREYAADATRWTVLKRTPELLLSYRYGFFLLLAAPVASVVAWRSRTDRRGYVLLLLWVLSLWLPMMLLAGLLDPSSPRIRDAHVRYWYLIFPALYVAGTAVVVRLVRAVPRRGRGLTVLMVVALALSSSYTDAHRGRQNEVYRIFGATQWHEVRQWLEGPGADVERIYVDRRAARVLPLYTRSTFGRPIWDGEILLFEHGGGPVLERAEMSGAIVLESRALRFRRSGRLPEEYHEPGDGWEFAVRRADGSLRILQERTG